MYALKIRGKAKIPDYVQLRDEHFTLLAYFRLDRPEKAISKCGLVEYENVVLSALDEMPFGKITEIKLS
ncbi:MAG TPA: fructose-6-phosphate aldolase [Bacteroidia bacterium]|nr:fructose-6-phosphate aldolase [Bacteroidia bacterium]HNT79294.1 fructose-6-phosphate aldolase [Bacteroidia bacterium]